MLMERVVNPVLVATTHALMRLRIRTTIAAVARIRTANPTRRSRSKVHRDATEIVCFANSIRNSIPRWITFNRCPTVLPSALC